MTRILVLLSLLAATASCKPSSTTAQQTADIDATAPDAAWGVATALTAGSGAPPTEADASVATTAQASPERDAAVTSILDPKAELRLHHGACFGKCKELTLKLLADGSFTGRGAPKSLDANTTRELFDTATIAFTPPPHCGRGPTDVQYVTVTLIRDGAKHTATHPRRSSCSKALTDLEAKLEAIP